MRTALDRGATALPVLTTIRQSRMRRALAISFLLASWVVACMARARLRIRARRTATFGFPALRPPFRGEPGLSAGAGGSHVRFRIVPAGDG